MSSVALYKVLQSDIELTCAAHQRALQSAPDAPLARSGDVIHPEPGDILILTMAQARSLSTKVLKMQHVPKG